MTTVRMKSIALVLACVAPAAALKKITVKDRDQEVMVYGLIGFRAA